MRVTCKLLLGLALLQGAAYAQGPTIDVVDGKISVTAQAVPLGRFLTLFGRAVGMETKVKPGLENRNISVMFSDLGFDDAVRKIFEGRSLNYVVVKGKTIAVVGLSEGSPAGAAVASAPSSSSPQFNNPAPAAFQPVQNPVPAAASPFPTANPVNNPNPVAPASGPGIAPPPLGTMNNPGNNPMNNPIGGAGPTGAPMGNIPSGPGAPPPVQPSGPGAVPGAAPGTIR